MLLQGCGGSSTPDLLTVETVESAVDETLIAPSVEPTQQTVPGISGISQEVSDDKFDAQIDTDGLIAPDDVDSVVTEGTSTADMRGEEGNLDEDESKKGADSEEPAAIAEPPYRIIPPPLDLTNDVDAAADPVAVLHPDEPIESFVVDTNDSSGFEETPQLSDDSEQESSSVSIEPEPEHTDQDMTDSSGAEILQSSDPDTTESAGIGSITDLIFLTGQSNAASLVTKYDAKLDAPDERVFAYTDQGWQVADLHQFWDEGIPGNFSADDPTREPYNSIIFQVGKALASKADRRVGIVMLTAPGEGISHWDYNGTFYNKVRDHAIAALNEVPHKASYDAVVWMQGETDWLLHGTADPDIPEFESYQSEAYLYYYPRKLNGLIKALRSDPWFGDSARFICTETIKAAVNTHLMGLNSDDDPLTGCAAASDLAARENDPHGNHFSADSLRVLGQRIADVYLMLQP